jgi:LPLT family lysophospholipid transporter-like MFS transporter
MNAPAWMTPLLKLFFVLSYVLLAAFVGAFADALPKGRVMFITNLIKVVGCADVFTVHPLLAYAVVGFGAAAYSPAKYGILTELLPPEKLVAANGWIEGLTVASIILGTVLGGTLVNPKIGAALMAVRRAVSTPASIRRWKRAVRDRHFLHHCRTVQPAHSRYRRPLQSSGTQPGQADRGLRRLLHSRSGQDKLGQISLAVTTLFWGAGATLQFIVLKWAENPCTCRSTGPPSCRAWWRSAWRWARCSGPLRAAEKIAVRHAARRRHGPGGDTDDHGHNVWVAYPCWCSSARCPAISWCR